MAITQKAFLARLQLNELDELLDYCSDILPCYSTRVNVSGLIDSEDMVAALLKHSCDIPDSEDLLVFSVTEEDGKSCWEAWKAYQKAHPRKLVFMEAGSIHGPYKCRMYLFHKPPSKRKNG